jgi:hypothetical protein
VRCLPTECLPSAETIWYLRRLRAGLLFGIVSGLQGFHCRRGCDWVMVWLPPLAPVWKPISPQISFCVCVTQFVFN